MSGPAAIPSPQVIVMKLNDDTFCVGVLLWKRLAINGSVPRRHARLDRIALKLSGQAVAFLLTHQKTRMEPVKELLLQMIGKSVMVEIRRWTLRQNRTNGQRQQYPHAG